MMGITQVSVVSSKAMLIRDNPRVIIGSRLLGHDDEFKVVGRSHTARGSSTSIKLGFAAFTHFTCIAASSSVATKSMVTKLSRYGRTFTGVPSPRCR